MKNSKDPFHYYRYSEVTEIRHADVNEPSLPLTNLEMMNSLNQYIGSLMKQLAKIIKTSNCTISVNLISTYLHLQEKVLRGQFHLDTVIQ